MKRRFAISDIHGCLQSFVALLEEINFSKEDELYLLGDYIDRGPDSKGVIDHIWHLQEAGFYVKCLVGNHELMLLEALEDRDKFLWWAKYGGSQTLDSFACQKIEQVPEAYLQFIKTLPYYLEVENYLLVHAGFDFSGAKPFKNEVAMAWIRNWYDSIDRDWLDGRTIVHGHTPTPMDQIIVQSQHLAQLPVLVIDAGCVYSHSGLGHLCALNLTSQELIFQKRLD